MNLIHVNSVYIVSFIRLAQRLVAAMIQYCHTASLKALSPAWTLPRIARIALALSSLASIHCIDHVKAVNLQLMSSLVAMVQITYSTGCIPETLGNVLIIPRATPSELLSRIWYTPLVCME